MSDSDKVVLRSRLSVKMPPYDFAIVESERMVEVHSSGESASALMLERDAQSIGLSIRDGNGDLSIDAMNKALSELTLRDFRRQKKKLSTLPARVWEL